MSELPSSWYRRLTIGGGTVTSGTDSDPVQAPSRSSQIWVLQRLAAYTAVRYHLRDVLQDPQRREIHLRLRVPTAARFVELADS